MAHTGWQFASVIIGSLVGLIAIGTWFGRQLAKAYRSAGRVISAITRIESAIGLDDAGKTLRQNVTDLTADVGKLKASLDNGIRGDIRSARDHAAEARVMAGRAAAQSSVANQHAEDAIRATNALRAEVNALTNVAMQDHNGIWRALRHLGIDRRQYDEDADGQGGDDTRSL